MKVSRVGLSRALLRFDNIFFSGIKVLLIPPTVPPNRYGLMKLRSCVSCHCLEDSAFKREKEVFIRAIG